MQSKYLKFVKLYCGILVELFLICFIVWKFLNPSIKFEIGVNTFLIVIIGIVVSNLASAWVIEYVKDDYLWKKVGAIYKHPVDPNRSIHDWWFEKEQGHGSNLSLELGFMERIILIFSGVISLKFFFAAAAAWTTYKVAVDWQNHKEMKYRAIGHIYIISSILSILCAGIDTLAVRAIFGLSI